MLRMGSWISSLPWTTAEVNIPLSTFRSDKARCTTSLGIHKSRILTYDKIVELFWVKTREIVVVLDFSAVKNFDFTRKIVKENWDEKLVKMLRICIF